MKTIKNLDDLKNAQEKKNEGFTLIVPVITENGDKVGISEYYYDKNLGSFFNREVKFPFKEDSQEYNNYINRLINLCNSL